MTDTQTRMPVGQLLAHRRALHAAEEAMAPHLRCYGLSVTSYLMLTVLAGPGGAPMRMVDLATRMGLTSGGATKMVDAATMRGLVIRRKNPEDKRGQMVEMTAYGLRIWERAEARFVELDVAVLQ